MVDANLLMSFFRAASRQAGQVYGWVPQQGRQRLCGGQSGGFLPLPSRLQLLHSKCNYVFFTIILLEFPRYLKKIVNFLNFVSLFLLVNKHLVIWYYLFFTECCLLSCQFGEGVERTL